MYPQQQQQKQKQKQLGHNSRRHQQALVHLSLAKGRSGAAASWKQQVRLMRVSHALPVQPQQRCSANNPSSSSRSSGGSSSSSSKIVAALDLCSAVAAVMGVLSLKLLQDTANQMQGMLQQHSALGHWDQHRQQQQQKEEKECWQCVSRTCQRGWRPGRTLLLQLQAAGMEWCCMNIHC
jgi:hypothetical protein